MGCPEEGKACSAVEGMQMSLRIDVLEETVLLNEVVASLEALKSVSS